MTHALACLRLRIRFAHTLVFALVLPILTLTPTFTLTLQLISGSWDGSAKIWDVAGGACVTTLAGHENGVCVLGFPDGKASVEGKQRLQCVTVTAVWRLLSLQR